LIKQKTEYFQQKMNSDKNTYKLLDEHAGICPAFSIRCFHITSN